jgi:outer membrane protein assembly factor BamB
VPVTTYGGVLCSAAVASNGSAVYIGSPNGYLYALNPNSNGAPIWSDYLGAPIYSSPAVSASDDTIYIGTWANGLFAIDAATGYTNWVFQSDDTNNLDGGTDSAPAIGPDCTIYFVAQTGPVGDLFAFSPNGSLQWFFPFPTFSTESPTATPTASPAIGKDGTIYVGSVDGYLYAISPSGTLEWIFDTFDGSAIESSPAIGGDGTVYIASTDGNLYAVTNGILKWGFTNQPYYPFVSSPAVTADGTVYIGSTDYNVYAITNGEAETNFLTGGQVLSSPAIANGAVYIGSEDGYLYALPSSAGLASSAWPMFLHDPRHTAAGPNPNCSSGAAAVAFPNNAWIYTNNSSSTFSFYLSGTPGSLWGIFASSDLAAWIAAGSVSLDSSGIGSFSGSSGKFVLFIGWADILERHG